MVDVLAGAVVMGLLLARANSTIAAKTGESVIETPPCARRFYERHSKNGGQNTDSSLRAQILLYSPNLAIIEPPKFRRPMKGQHPYRAPRSIVRYLFVDLERQVATQFAL